MSSPYPAYGNHPQGSADRNLYPPNGTNYNFDSSSTVALPKGKTEVSGPRILRTPSPTPSEAAELARPSLFDWKTLSNWRFWIRREWLWYYIIGGILTVITVLITAYHTTIIKWLTPAANWMKDLPAGWLIPIGILFVISFPPLFGHEVVAILCGVVWGLWIGFAIVAAGTFIGELGNFYAFKYCCRARGEKLEKSNISYACLARVVRDGGFKIAVIARFSAIPGHFTTAVFSTCGMSVWTFAIAAFLTLPKQFVTVYLGVLIDGSANVAAETTGQRIASYSVLALTVIITFVALWYIYREMSRVKVTVIYERRKARQEKMELAGMPYGNSAAFSSSSTVSIPFNPRGSESDIPLRPYDPESQEYTHQQWDASGRAVGYAGDPRLHAPRPERATGQRIPTLTERDTEVGVQYPTSPRVDGRIPVRQGSGDSWENAHAMQTPQQPTYASQQLSYGPPAGPPPSSQQYFPPPPPGGRTLSPPPIQQYANYHPETLLDGASLPTPPFGGASSPRTAPVGAAGNAATYYAPPSSAALPPPNRSLSPAPPSYRTAR
ncbi:hypothetical protein BV25DRAFT_1964418 [Artomyces pyxidatus]|uniref:Uncharacterized protein n=1 Tax=Artomyces pyxidatus TaxID=48021 RepID=A0ACB8SRP9_9AGAM|nr:hypothetical protein BV25DRAFT_1964418 [Artomyces pyxidatus]